ncbi:MAG TPA: hypothetical protein VGH76_27270 [Actinomycetospora sp.]|jgi:hypothetical protein|uniref:hypothetical protein n=1 Tax=Actinomycetospora sp. TaxID=1872135 RepID=UPI002F4206C3
MARSTKRFDGWIGGLGTTSGLRLVVGHWPTSPYGSFTDVMLEEADGHRVLLAPTQQVADFVGTTYTFDEVRLVPVEMQVGPATAELRAGDLTATIHLGRRTPLGYLLRDVPTRLATAPRWIATIDTVARRVLPGVRTVGSAGHSRTEYYGARDLHRITDAEVHVAGEDQGPMTGVDPPVRFGFGSTPTAPSWVRITTMIRSATTPA